MITASSELKLSALEASGETLPLTHSWGMLLPVQAGQMPLVEFMVDVTEATTLQAELSVSTKRDNYTPDEKLAKLDVKLAAGMKQRLPLHFDATVAQPCYALVSLRKNEAVSVHLSDQRLTGVLAVWHNGNKAVAKSSTQTPPPDSGLDKFEFWTPKRRPAGKNFALRLEPPLECFGAANLANGFARPTNQPNAWVACFSDEQPVVRLEWREPQLIARIELCFDTDFDHPMESVLMGQPERVTPFCVREVAVALSTKVLVAAEPDHGVNPSDSEQLVFEVSDNHQSRQIIRLRQPVTTDCLELRLLAPSVNVPAALFQVQCYTAP
jgi:hypothetical protein